MRKFLLLTALSLVGLLGQTAHAGDPPVVEVIDVGGGWPAEGVEMDIMVYDEDPTTCIAWFEIPDGGLIVYHFCLPPDWDAQVDAGSFHGRVPVPAFQLFVIFKVMDSEGNVTSRIIDIPF